MAADTLVLGIDLGGTDTKYGIIDAAGGVVRRSKHPTEAEQGPEAVLDRIAEHSRELIGTDNVAIVGMGVPGPMSSREGIVYETPNLKWYNVPVRDMLSQRLGMRVVLNNDANAAAYGEYWAGAGRGTGGMILFTLGTGIGGGIIINGELFSGPDDTAGELGHMIIQRGGPLCGCGNHGCLEALASATAIRRIVREAIEDGVTTSIELPENDEDFGAKLVHDAAVDGDMFAIQVLREVGTALGIGAATCINIFNPEMIVYSGAMTKAGDYIMKPLRETAVANSFEKPGTRVRIVLSELGTDAGIIGAAGLALKVAGRA